MDMRHFPSTLVLAVGLIAPGMAHADAPANVPVEFQDLYPVLQQDLDQFQQTLDAQWNKQTTPVNFAGELLTANSAQGTKLLAPGYINGVKLEINALKSMGANTFTIAVHFPVMYQPYFASAEGSGTGHTAQDFTNFYQQVIAYGRSLNMKVVIE